MSDIQMCNLSCFLRSVLPNMWTQNFSAGCKNNVCSGVMSLQLLSSDWINLDINSLSFVVALKWLIKGVQHNFTYFNCINDVVLFLNTFDSDDGVVMLLSSRCWVNSILVENQKIWNILLKHILIHIQDLGIELHQAVVFVEKVISLLQVSSVVQDGFSSLGSSFLTHCDFVVKILWDWCLDDLRDQISWDTMRLHANNPVIKGKFSLSLLDDLVKLFYRLFIRVLPSIVLNLDDSIETLVLWEFSINTCEILLVVLKDFKETLHSENFPPAGSLHDGEATSQDVSNVTTSSNVGWESSIRDGDQESSGMVQNDIKVLYWLNCGFYCLNINTYLLCNILPALVNIINLIDIEGA